MLGVVLVVLLVGGVWRILHTSGGACASPSEYTVAADQSLVDVAEREAARAADSCTSFTIQTVPDSAMPGLLAGGGAIPDLWLASSKARVDTVGTEVGRDLPATTVASSPIVVAGAKPGTPTTWLEALSASDLHAVPVDAPNADAPLIVAVAESGTSGSDQQALTAALVHLAQSAPTVQGEPVSAAARAGGVVVVPESQYLAAKKGDPALAAVVPQVGTVLNQIPLVVTASGDRVTGAETAEKLLAGAFASREGAGDLKAAGLRDADGTAAPDGGVGTVVLLPEPDKSKLAEGERLLAAVAVPLKTLVVMDTSGSMAEQSGSTTRIGMAVAGFDRVVSQISDADAIGLWSFSSSTRGAPWNALVPVAPLAAKRGSVTQRTALVDAMNGLRDRVGGGTALYTTILAAYKQAQREFDPAYSNSIIVLTDGTDEDADTTTLAQLIAGLTAIIDPAKPITINTVGISGDADMNAIEAISAATDGTALRADSEQQMLADFVTAVANRTRK
ncbi:VWA domain-containing protein [Tsukamurella soli]|uniref:VWA domain-containing protein n=1 Tax=Tsukamurella soli TaxID=644556 RepID=UPI0031E632D6